jgi:signal transduction histidine kinase
MSIQDDGRGFEAPETVVELARSGKLGLIGMHERARILGGSLRIDSRLGQGTTVIVEVPLHPAPR